MGLTTWGSLLRVVLKAAILFGLANLAFAAGRPLEGLGGLSLYNGLLPGRPRLPYGENPAESYNLSLNNVPAMMASHVISRPQAADEFRVALLGDSGVWGWLLESGDTLAGHLNAAGLVTADGRQVVVYNLGYPIMSLTKDLLLLDEALAHEPDLVLWLVTLQSLPREGQLEAPLVQHNPARVRRLIERHGLRLEPDDGRLVERGLLEETIAGRRRDLADLLRLQLYGFSWAATGIDQAFPADVRPRQSDFDEDLSWQGYEEPVRLTGEALAFEALAAGVAMAGETPLVIVNEPTFVSRGRNSHLRYNAFYPRWAYDQYRQLLAEQAAAGGWRYVDLWDAMGAEAFTDSPVHLTAEGSAALGQRLGRLILEAAAGGQGTVRE